MTYTFLRYRPDRAYRTNYLMVPKTALSPVGLCDLRDGKLTIQVPIGRGGRFVTHRLWRESEHHLFIPREYPWTDQEPIRVESEYEPVAFESRRRDFLDEEQRQAWQAFAEAGRGVLNLACGRGKSFLACLKIAQRGMPALIIVSNTGSVTEWEREIRSTIYTGRIGRIQGQRFDWHQPVTISTVQTLMNRVDTLPEEVRRYYGTIIWDEVHHISADRFKRTASIFWGARFGLSATVNRPDGLEDIYLWHIGPVFHSDLYQELTPRVYFLVLPTTYPDMQAFYDRGGELSMSLLYRALTTDPIRNKAIARLIQKCLSANRHILVLGHSVPGLYALQKEVEVGTVISEDTPQSRRATIIRETAVTYATPSLAKEALNAPSLDTVLFITPFRDWNTLQQGMGRALRRYGNKNHPLVVIIEDAGVGPSVGLCRTLKYKLKEHDYEYDVTSIV